MGTYKDQPVIQIHPKDYEGKHWVASIMDAESITPVATGFFKPLKTLFSKPSEAAKAALHVWSRVVMKLT